MSIFCSTCLQNQQFLIEALSNILPDPDNPKYSEIDASLPEHRKTLEARYPQVCASCEPKVKAQLQQATYTAKSDHIRRVLERSRARRISNTWGWRSLIVRLAGIGYWLSITGQILWHALAAFSNDAFTPEISRPTNCLHQLFSHKTTAADCPKKFEPLAAVSIAIGVLCIWYNPKWQHKLQSREGRMMGLSTFYKAQIGILALRFAAWQLLQDRGLASTRQLPRKSIHSVLLVLLIVLALWSTSLVKIDTTPLVNWSQAPPPLLSKQQFVPPQRTPQASNPKTNPVFSINNLAPAPVQTYDAWQARTPSEDPDAMDWEPLHPQFQPNPKQPTFKSTQPSPFYGTLPALPAMGLSIPNTSKPPAREAIGIPPGFFDRPRNDTGGRRSQEGAPPPLAEPKFFPEDADTGLEGIFDQVFSLRDEPQLPPTIPISEEQRAPERFWTTASLVAAIALPGVFFSVIAYFALF